MHCTKHHDRFFVYMIYSGLFEDFKNPKGKTLNIPKAGTDIFTPLYIGKTFRVLEERIREHNKPGHVLDQIRKCHKDVTVRYYECKCEGEMDVLEKILIYTLLPEYNDESSRNKKKLNIWGKDAANALVLASQYISYSNSDAEQVKLKKRIKKRAVQPSFEFVKQMEAK